MLSLIEHRLVWVSVLMFATLLFASCGSGFQAKNKAKTGTSVKTTLSSEAPNMYFPQQKSESSSPTALISGELYLDSKGCLRLETPDGVSFTPIWQQSMKPQIEGDTVAVVNEKGRVLARTGELVRMSGGEPGSLKNLPAVSKKTARELRQRCPGGYWLVGFEVWMPPKGKTHS